MDSNIRETPFVKQLAANGTSFGACSTIKSRGILCVISINPILFSVLSVSIWKSHDLNLSTIDLCIASRQCAKIRSALSSPKRNPALPSEKRLVHEQHENHASSIIFVNLGVIEGTSI